MHLVIVESPTKAKTISHFLGKGYKIESSYGHVRDLPKSRLGVDVESDFGVQYVIPKKSLPRVKELRKSAARVKDVILATDEDREGEAIAWHLQYVLKNPLRKGDKSAIPTLSFSRIVFHEITESAIREALLRPRDLDMHLVDAQQARRVLDRLVGYSLSPFLWKKIMGGLSAGRVQSVALRLIVMREEEIRNFKPEDYYSISALLQKSPALDSQSETPTSIEAVLYRINGEVVPKPGIRIEEEAREIVEDLKDSIATVSLVRAKEVVKNPLPPFITSTLQQAAATRLGFSSKKTMFVAQHLYESGRITYMRTDSVNLSEESLKSAKIWISQNIGNEYAREAPRIFKKKSRLAQEAHEAIRPTSTASVPQKLGGVASFQDKDEVKLYELIWRRFIASQMPRAVFDTRHIEFSAGGKSGRDYVLSANGNTLKFDGFLKFWPVRFSERELPELHEGEELTVKSINAERHQTEPPPRYSEASLIKELEKNGIGRPSTYAPTISTIILRNYVEKIQGRFHPTETGELVNTMLAEHFPEIIDIDFTAKMEEGLDEVAEGKTDWRALIKGFYEPFREHLKQKYEEVEKEKIEETTDEVCDKCSRPMSIKRGRFGKFLACTGFPECKNAKSLKEKSKKIDMKCPKCGEGEIVEKRVSRGRARGKIFWGCLRYPDCDYASWKDPRK